MLIAIVRREILLAWRSGSEIFNPLWFFLIVITLYPLSVGPDPQLLARIAPAVIWITAILACLLGLERLFRDDFNDGSLEQLMVLPTPLPFVVLGKVIGHWLITGLPLVILSPLAALFLSLSFFSCCTLAGTLLAGTLIFSFVGSIGVALTVGLPRGGVLLSLLVLPLMIPVLIFASAAISAASQGDPILGDLAILGAFLLLCLVFTPFACAAALRIALH